MLSRRTFLASSIGTLLAAGALAKHGHDTDKFKLVEIPIQIADLDKAFENYRIGFISDMHFGMFIPHEWIEKVASILNNASIDLLLLGGDYVWIPEYKWQNGLPGIRNPKFANYPYMQHVDPILVALADLLACIKAPDGIAAIAGNHDRWVGIEHFVTTFGEKGFKVLVNDLFRITRDRAELQIVGVDDYWSGIPKIPVLDTTASKATRILLAHNPDYFSELLAAKKFNFELGLGGHTHGGQVKLPFFGAMRYNVKDSRFREGLYSVDNTHIYTTRGTGVVEIPWRINCPPEVSVITLKQA